MFIANLKVRNKLLLLIGMVILGFIGSTLVGIGTINRVKVGSKLYIEIKKYRDALEGVEHLKSDLNGARVLIATMLFMTEKDILNQLRNEIKELTSNINEEFNKTINLVKGEEIAIKTALTSAQFTWTEFVNTTENEYFPAVFSGENIKALELATGVQKLRQNRFIEQVDSAVFTIKLKVEELEENTNEIVKKSTVFLMLGSAIFVLVIIFFAWFISMSITKPLHELTTVVETIGKGDLSQRAEVKSRDEIGNLATSFNKMTKDLKKSRDELISTQDYTDNIIKSMIDTLIVVDPDANIKTVNKATSDLLGYKGEDLIGKPVATIFAEEEEEEEEVTPFKGTKMAKLIEEGSIRDYDMTYKTKSGEKILVSFSGSVMRDKEGELVGIVGIARDMRETKRLMEKEKELAAAAAAAAETDKKKAVELEKAYKELSEKSVRLEKFHNLTVGREIDMAKLKEEINTLLEKLGQPKKYETPEKIKGTKEKG